jgi:zona occludens toxin
MITLVTGVPGGGKTLWTVVEIVEKLLSEGREIYTNIKGLDLSSIKADTSNVYIIDDEQMIYWEQFPDESIFIFDECQHYFPPRHSTAKKVSYIEALQTHRHRGMDFYFITQEPSLIDKRVRSLVGRHVHQYRPMGLQFAQTFEWPTVNESPNPSHSSSSAYRRKFKFPKKYYKLYKSATKHTHKVNLPWRIIGLIIFSLVGITFGAYFFVTQFFGPMWDSSAQPYSLAEINNSNRVIGPDSFQGSIHCVSKGRLGSMYLIKQENGQVYALSKNNLLDLCLTMK